MKRKSRETKLYFHAPDRPRDQISIANSLSISRSLGKQRAPQTICRALRMFQKPFYISQLAIPAVWVLIAFLTFTSQYLFWNFEAVPLRENELWSINILAGCIGICYYRSCTVDPGRVPKDWEPSDHKQLGGVGGRQRWCRKCEAFKPPRTHHCKTCGRYAMIFQVNLHMTDSFRCIPKMDHHCPWTTNCVSHFTFPHFVRFLFYAVVGMSYLESCLFERASTIWASRHLPRVGRQPE